MPDIPKSGDIRVPSLESDAERLNPSREVSLEPGRQAPEVSQGQAPPAKEVARQVLDIVRDKLAEPPSEQSPIINPKSKIDSDPIPARMLNEFVYCPRLFYYEFVEGVFVESADTQRGSNLHQRVDGGAGALPVAQQPATANPEPRTGNPEPEAIHSRSVSMGSDRLNVTAKMDLVEARPNANVGETGDLLALEVCPVDYKVGAPKAGEDANELWDTDKMQLGLQALILRDNGYTCNEGIIYYRATKQRVRLPITPELETWILERIDAARKTAQGSIPPPLVNSPKCVRCSLAPVCLPDETRLLATPARIQQPPSIAPAKEPPRRLIAARDDRRALYLNTPGLRIGCKESVLQVKDKDTLLDQVRISDLTQVALFGNIQISTQAIQVLCEAEVPITYFSMGGWFYGITRGHELTNVFLRIEQFRLARDPATCLRLARQFVHGKIRNHRTMLMRNHLEPPEPVLLRLKNSAETALGAESIEELLGIEGAAASFYFEQFSGMIKVADDLAIPESSVGRSGPGEPTLSTGGRASPRADQLFFNFNFAQRNRRPPTDPVNAMLSLAYSVLSKDCTVAALAVGFDPYVGFYHQPRFGRPALALDLMEEFRPLIAESVVLNCINNRIVTEKDFVRAGKTVNMTAAGRRRFFQTYEQRMTSLLTHPVFDYKVSYRRALELQARILAKTLTGEIAEYIPLTTR